MSVTETGSERVQALEQKLEKLKAEEDVVAEDPPEDTQAELERVKHVLSAAFGIDLRSPGQVKQAELDGLEAELELVKQEEEAAKQAAEEEAAAEAEAAGEETSDETSVRSGRVGASSEQATRSRARSDT